MINSPSSLPYGGFGFSYAKSYEANRCDPIYLGLSLEKDPAAYQWDNRPRENAYMFQCTLGGEGRLWEGRPDGRGIEHALPVGKAFIVPFPSDTRYWLPKGKTWEFVYLVFNGEVAMEHAGRLIRQAGYMLEIGAASPALQVLLEMYRIARENRKMDEFTASAWTYRFLMELCRHIEILPEAVPDEIERAKKHLETNYENAQLTVADAAMEAGLSKFYFSRLFRKHTGASPHAFLVRLRVRGAAELLLTTDLPVKRIAAMSGFGDYPYFCHVFKQHTRTTPGALRQQKLRFRIEEFLPN